MSRSCPAFLWFRGLYVCLLNWEVTSQTFSRRIGVIMITVIGDTLMLIQIYALNEQDRKGMSSRMSTQLNYF